MYLEGLGVSRCEEVATPVGNIDVDVETQRSVVSDMLNAGVKCLEVSKSEDEEEHSGEMQYPLISHLLKEQECKAKIVPFMVGSTSPETSSIIGKGEIGRGAK